MPPTAVRRRPRAAVPLFDPEQKLGLILFGFNMNGGTSMTFDERALKGTWQENWDLVRNADAAGFDAYCPVARWKGFGGPGSFNSINFELFTWAAGLVAAGPHMMPMVTLHVPTVHPVVAAKAAVTIDHMSRGKFGMNITYGWYQNEFDMFGIQLLDHAERYAYTQEWLDIVKKLWSEEKEFDFPGKYFNLKGAYCDPKPIQEPRPTIMYAGASTSGLRWGVQHADLIYTRGENIDQSEANAAQVSGLAKEFGREVEIVAPTYMYCMPTEKEAIDYFNYSVFEKGDRAAAEIYLRNLGGGSVAAIHALTSTDSVEQYMAGFHKYPLIGTPDQVVERLLRISKAGYRAITLSAVDYFQGVDIFGKEVMPRLIQAGLRTPRKDNAWDAVN